MEDVPKTVDVAAFDDSVPAEQQLERCFAGRVNMELARVTSSQPVDARRDAVAAMLVCHEMGTAVGSRPGPISNRKLESLHVSLAKPKEENPKRQTRKCARL